MNIVSQDFTFVPSSLPPIMVVIAKDIAAARRLEREAGEAGVRVAAIVTPSDALERLKAQIRLDAIWFDWSSCAGDPCLKDILDWLDQDEFGAEARVIASTTLDDIDEAVALLPGGAQLLCQADAMDRSIAMASLLATAPHVLCDVGTDRKVEQLSKLSEEVQRIARVLASLSSPGSEQFRRDQVVLPTMPEKSPSAFSLDAQEVRQMIRIRRMRNQFFNGELFADPAWDMLLDLMAAKLEQKRVAVSSLCIAADVPATTALRWIKTMTDNGMFRRIADPTDGRRIFIELSEGAFSAMKAYFSAVGRVSPFAI